MKIQPYLFFDGQCEQALQFYRAALGAEVQTLMRYRDSPEPPVEKIPAGNEDKILHSSFKIGETELMASDGFCRGNPEFSGFSLSITFPDHKAAKQAFERLAEGGEVKMPLDKTFFSPCFGMVTDKFQIGWMIIVMQ